MVARVVAGRGPLGAHLGAAGTHSGSRGPRVALAPLAATAAALAETVVGPRRASLSLAHSLPRPSTDRLTRLGETEEGLDRARTATRRRSCASSGPTHAFHNWARSLLAKSALISRASLII